MKLVVDLHDPESLGREVMGVMKRMGMVMCAPKRVEPYRLKELVEISGTSDTTISRLVHAGVLKRVPHVGRVLLTVESVEAWLAGREAGNE